MRSIRNHLSLIIALVSILFSIQFYVIIERAIDAYKYNLTQNYSMIVLSKKSLTPEEIIAFSPLVDRSSEISSQSVIDRFSADLKSSSVEMLKIMLPYFYEVSLKYYPSPNEIKSLKQSFLSDHRIIRVEDFSQSHDVIYKLLLLFKTVITIFSAVILVVTTLLIFKELKIWQYQHHERMSIMALFGAPLWLRSAILFRLAIVDAIISSAITVAVFVYFSSSEFVKDQLSSIGISILFYDLFGDTALLVASSLGASILLAMLIIIGHKEEV